MEVIKQYMVTVKKKFGGGGAGKTIQWVKYLLYKYSEPCLDPQHPFKNLGMATCKDL